jgi:hypothetical protein
MEDTKPKTNTQEIIDADAFITTMQEKLLGQSGAVSSASSEIEKVIKGAVKGVKESTELTNRATESSFNRQIQDVRQAGNYAFTGGMEEQRGFATNVGLLKKINEDTNKNVNDLEQRKQELILQGNAAAASKIAELQLNALQFKQQAEQQAFQNLLSMSNFGLSVRQEKRQQRAQDFAERSAISQIALEFGLPISENDTIDSVVAKAAPLATEDRKLKLEQIRADIANSRAQAAKAMQGDPGDSPFDALTAALLAEKIDTGEVDAGMIIDLNGQQRASIMDARSQLRATNKKQLEQIAASSRNEAEFMEKISQSPKVYNTDDVLEIATSIKARPKEKGALQKLSESLFSNKPTQKSQPSRTKFTYGAEDFNDTDAFTNFLAGFNK